MKLVTIGPVVSEKSFEIVDKQTKDRQRMGDDNGTCLYYKLPWSNRLRSAKKKFCGQQFLSRVSQMT